jgi:hypothetical protein
MAPLWAIKRWITKAILAWGADRENLLTRRRGDAEILEEDKRTENKKPIRSFYIFVFSFFSSEFLRVSASPRQKMPASKKRPLRMGY